MKPPRNPAVVELNKRYGFRCDALSHIEMLSFLTGISQATWAEMWNKIRSAAPNLLDETGNIRPFFLMNNGYEKHLSDTMTKLLSPID